MPEGWDISPKRLHQMGLDARCTKKNVLSYFSYKNIICINVRHWCIRRYAVSPVNIYDSQVLLILLDPENKDVYFWADSTYARERFEDLLNLGGFESWIHEKGSRNHALSDAAKERNRFKSAIRACVEYIVGCMTMSMGRMMTKKIGLERNQAWRWFKNMT